MTYDTVRKKVVVFGGLGSAGYLAALGSYTTNSGAAGLAADAMLTYAV